MERARAARAGVLLASALAAGFAAGAADIEMLDGSVVRGRIVRETPTAFVVEVGAPGRGVALMSVSKARIHAVKDGGEVRVVNARADAPAPPPAPRVASQQGGTPAARTDPAPRTSAASSRPGPAKASAPFGYRGDGTCVAEGPAPPVEWDGTTGKNILWKTLLPSWCLGAPAVGGGRVYVMSEPDRDHDFPVVLCLDDSDGRVLWQREIDHIALMEMSEQEKADLRKVWHEHLVALRNLYRARHVARTASDKDHAAKEIEALGCALNAKGEAEWKFGDGSKRSNRVDVALARTFNRAGLYFDVWHLGGLGRIGYAYPTPVTDGERVYVATGLHAFACFDAEGNVLWQHHVRGQGSSNAGYGGDDFCKNARSPLVYGDLFISDVGSLVRAFDRKTGRLVWRDKITAHEIVSPVVIAVSGKDILLCGGLNGYVLPEGKKLAVQGWGNHGGTMLVKSDERDVVFFTGGGEHGGWENKGNPPCTTPPPAAARFSLDGDALKAEVLWSGIDGKSSGECHAGFVYCRGRLYHPQGTILDAATGKVLAGRHRDRHAAATPATRHLTWVAGERLYGVKAERRAKDGPEGGQCQVFDLEGRRVAESVLPLAPVEGERRERIIETVGGPGWGFGYGCPFAIASGRIYVRSNDYLFCIGAR